MPAIRCPKCRSEAYYNYGHTRNGKQRYICLVCDRQFINRDSGNDVQQRPGCPLCGKKMHVYMRGPWEIRFRCSTYPQCRGYAKMKQET
jgi:transposase-like protein